MAVFQTTFHGFKGGIFLPTFNRIAVFIPCVTPLFGKRGAGGELVLLISILFSLVQNSLMMDDYFITSCSNLTSCLPY